MLQSEFTERTKVQVSDEEFDTILDAYLNSGMNEDRFCAMWCKMNRSRVLSALSDTKQYKTDGDFSLFGLLAEKVTNIVRTAVKNNGSDLIWCDLNNGLKSVQSICENCERFTLYLVVNPKGMLLTFSESESVYYFTEYDNNVTRYRIDGDSICGNSVTMIKVTER